MLFVRKTAFMSKKAQEYILVHVFGICRRSRLAQGKPVYSIAVKLYFRLQHILLGFHIRHYPPPYP